ncbi:MAG: serine/threonine-protein kinase [Polyangiales bacterium]
MAHPSTATAPSDPLIGTTINDRFKVLGLVAKGGMGKVYKAEQSPLGRIVAVKVLHPNYSGDGDPEFSKRFTLEASVVSRLKHPNTVTVYDYGETADGVYFMAMEYLEGKTLHRLIREEGSLEVGRALHILVQVARSLREAHGQGVIHRDLKPANIFLIRHDDDSDFVKVLDFGLVKNLDENDGESLTKTGLFMGSPKYMAPEQIRGDRVTPATDVYALGVILFEMLAGKVPYDRPNSANLLLAHVNEPVPTIQSVNPLVSVPAAIEEITYRCMAKAPEDRFQSMEELIAAIKHAGIFVSGLGPSMTGEFHNSLSAPRAQASGESARATTSAMPPLPQSGGDPTISAGEAPTQARGPLSSQFAAAPLTAPAAPHAEPAPARSPLPIAIGVVALLLAAAAAYVSVSRNKPVTTQPTALQTDRTVSLVLESDPTGAEVYEHGALVGRTPLRETWSGARANPDEQHTFTFRHDGYGDAVVTLTGATLVHIARLQRIEAPSAPPPLESADAGAVPAVERGAHRPVVRVSPRARDAGGAPAGYRTNVY